jgi:limonene-1,2-epoxide hydrolase
VTERFSAGLSQKVKVTVHGASIVKAEDGKVTDWVDYYDGLTSWEF